MFPSLPDECKQLLWQCFDASTLCRVACVARGVENGVALAPLWKSRAVAMVRHEITRIESERLPIEDALQRQNATRRLDLSAHSSDAASTRGGTIRSLVSQHEEKNEDEEETNPSHDMDARFWRVWYRDFHLAVHGFHAAHRAFDAAKHELQERKKQRAEVRALLQATKSTSHNDKNLRRMQMNCVRWLNRTSRRAAAASHASTAQTTAFTKSEIIDELQVIETAIQWQSKLIFSVRSQYQKALHKRTSAITRGKRLLAELDT